MKTLLLAQWVAPMDRPPIRDGAVLFEAGRILAVGDQHTLRSDHPDAIVADTGSSVVLPGLINAHTHLELSDCKCGPPLRGGFAAWLKAMIARTGLDQVKMAAAVSAAVLAGANECLRFGVTAVGDITRQHRLTRPLLRNSPLRVVSYGEVAAMAQRRDLLEERLADAIDPACASDRLRIGLSPHSPYSVEPQGYLRCMETARQQGMPLTTHLAESPDEAPFLAHHAGPLRELWDSMGRWDEHVPRFEGGPIRFAHSLGLLDYPTSLAHVNYCSDSEMDLLAQGRASVVYCPRTHAWFAHPPHRWRDMLQRGINVAVGTDSRASSPDLNLVEDLRFLHRLAPALPPEVLWSMATLRAARAINMETELGSITPHKQADLAIFPTTQADPLREILESPLLPTQVSIAGRQVAGAQP